MQVSATRKSKCTQLRRENFNISRLKVQII